MKKARAWLAAHGIEEVFHNYKKEGVSETLLRTWCTELGWESLLNKRGTTWRKLSPAEQSEIDEGKAVELMMAHPSLIKRPVLDAGGHLYAGFSAEKYEQIFLP